MATGVLDDELEPKKNRGLSMGIEESHVDYL